MLLLDLNDDCLLHLIGYLETLEHMQLFSTCERLRACIQNYYRRNALIIKDNFWNMFSIFEVDPIIHDFTKDINQIIIKDIRIQSIDFVRYLPVSKITQFNFVYTRRRYLSAPRLNKIVDVMQLFSANVEVIKFLVVCDLRIFEHIIFPKVTKLDVHSVGDFRLIAKIFPNLKILNSFIPYDYDHILKLRNLTNVTLVSNQSLEKYMDSIFSILPIKKLLINCSDVRGITKCQTIEEICFEDYLRHHFTFYGLFKLKALHKISFTKINDILSIPDHPQIVWKTLILSHDFIEKNKVENFFYRLKDVCHLTFFRRWCAVKKTETSRHLDKLVNIFTYCKNIEVFDISETFCDIEFLMKILNVCLDSFGERKKPLLIRCFKTNISENEAKQINLPCFVKLTFKLCTKSYCFKGKQKPFFNPSTEIHCDWINK